jgi:hypothetical protein
MKKIKSIFANKYTISFFVLTLLSGCGFDKDSADGNGFWKGQGLNFNSWSNEISQWMNNIGLSIAEFETNLDYSLKQMSISSMQGNIGQVFNTLGSIKILPNLITAVSIIGFTLVAVKFIWVVFKNYTLTFGEGETPVTFYFIKKAVFAMFFVLLAPYVIINGFLFASILGAQTVAYLAVAPEVNSEVLVAKDVSFPGLSLQTYCSEGVAISLTNGNSNAIPTNGYEGNTARLTEVKYFDSLIAQNYANGYNKDTVLEKITNLDQQKFLDGYWGFEYKVLYPSSSPNNTGPYMTRLYNSYCGSYDLPYDGTTTKFFPSRVIEALQKNTNLMIKTTLLVDGKMVTKYSKPIQGVWGDWFALLIMGIFGIIAFFTTAVRVGELFMAILSTPFFAISYLTTDRSNVMATWIQELSSIFLTHIITMVGFYAVMTEIMGNWNWYTPMIAVGLMWVLIKGPQSVRNWTSSTGVGGAGGSAVKGVAGMASKM